MRDIEETRMERLASDGRGLGRDRTGMVWMAPYTAPGDLARLVALRRRRRHVDGRCLELVESSSLRVEPRCRFFGRCGGCQLQHLEYGAQFRLKVEAALDTLCRQPLLRQWFGGRPSPRLAPAARPLGYRQRLRLFCGRRGGVGFREQGSHRLVEIDGCPLASDAVGRAAAAAAAGIPAGLSGLVRELIVEESPADGRVFVTLVCAHRPRPREQEVAAGFVRDLGADHGFAAGPGFSRMCLTGGEDAFMVFRTFAGRDGREVETVVEPGGFCQVNQEQNRELVRTVCALAGSGGKVLDLFCGAGNFSIPLALAGNRVCGCDLQRAAIRAAERNRVRAGCGEAVSFFRASAADGLERAAAGRDLLLVDPPRRGCPEIAAALGAARAAGLIYVSCNPATLARDLAAIIAAGSGWRPEALAMIDMFPQTCHIETVVSLSRR